LLGFQPFRIAVGRAEVFPGTNVVYFSLDHGWDELQSLHRHLAAGRLQFCEPFPYHPHITIAQKLTLEQAVAIQQAAQRRWDEVYRGPRQFSVETLSFVQNSSRDVWYDLAAIDLLDATPVR
jgi:2'-5' RNA ligase